MAFATIYILILTAKFLDILPFEINDEYFNATNALIAFGVFSICSRLNELIDKE